MFVNIFCPFVWEKSTLLSFVIFFTFFRVFLEIMKNGVRYLVALTPSIGLRLPVWLETSEMLENRDVIVCPPSFPCFLK